MVLLVQSLTFLFVVFSLFLVVSIPVIFATTETWENSKSTVSGLATFWVSLLVATTVANSFV
jgi:photosystem II core protein PsbZ